MANNFFISSFLNSARVFHPAKMNSHQTEAAEISCSRSRSRSLSLLPGLRRSSFNFDDRAVAICTDAVALVDDGEHGFLEFVF